MPEHDGERFLTCVGGRFHGEIVGPVIESTYVARRPVERRFSVSACGVAGWPPDLGVLEYETEIYKVAGVVCSNGRISRMLVSDGMDHAVALDLLLQDARRLRSDRDARDRLMRRGGMVG